MTSKVEALTSEVEQLRARVEWLEAALILVLSRAYGLTDSMSLDFPELRSAVRRRLPGLTEETNSRLRQEKHRRMERVRFDGSNVAEVAAFVEGDAAVSEHNGVAWIVGDAVAGRSVPLSDGSVIERDPDTARIHVTSERNFDMSDLYREVLNAGE